MTNIEVKFNVTDVFVRPSVESLGISNVIEKVIWKATLTRNGVSTIARGEIMLDTPETAEGFTDITQVTEQQVIDWVIIRLGGSVFIEGLKFGHLPHLQKLEQEAQLTRWTELLVGQELQEELNLSDMDSILQAIKNS